MAAGVAAFSSAPPRRLVETVAAATGAVATTVCAILLVHALNGLFQSDRFAEAEQRTGNLMLQNVIAGALPRAQASTALFEDDLPLSIDLIGQK